MIRSVSKLATRALLISSLLLVGTSSLQAQDKAGIFNQMQSLASQVQSLRSSGGDPAIVDQQVEALIRDYNMLSNQLGGDDPFQLRSTLPRPLKASFAKAAPPAPMGGTLTTASFANTDMTAIPDTGQITSDIVVSTGDTYLFDLDLTTQMTQTWSADLDVTLTSPAGTTVTVTTDNGGSNDDVFNGTLFDDQAGDAVTDFTYSDGVPATPLIPEGAFAAFWGEDPNGTWTLTVADDAGGDTGSLNGWSLDVTTIGGTVEATVDGTFSNSDMTAIPDTGQITSDIAVSGAGSYLCDVNLTTQMTQTWSADLDVTLTSPGGTTTTVTTDNGGSNDDVFNGTLFDDDAADTVTDFTYSDGVPATPLSPEGALGAFIGEDPNGTWTLTVADDAGGDTGSLNGWSLDITTCTAGGGFGQNPFDPNIPTLGEWGLLALLLALATAGVLFIRRQS